MKYETSIFFFISKGGNIYLKSPDKNNLQDWFDLTTSRLNLRNFNARQNPFLTLSESSFMLNSFT